MPKRVGFIYDRMCDKEMIRKAIAKGSKGKKKRHDVKAVLSDVEKYVEKIYNLLINDSYVPTIPKLKEIKDKSSGKMRVISIVPFYPDGIMHQLCVMAMQDVLMRGMYRWSCASIPKRGNACARKYVRRALDRSKARTKYCAKMDIYHCYPSISVKRLIKLLARKIKDKKFLRLVYKILASNTTDGLAIGFYINQWLANYMLEVLDHFITALDGVRYYVRNMDDLVLIGPNKRKLQRAVREIERFLNERLGLNLKGNWQVFPIDARGIDFVGYRFYHSHTSLRRKTFLRFTRQCRKIAKVMNKGQDPSFHDAAGILSRVGGLKHCNCVQARKKYYGVLDKKRIKAIVRLESIQRAKAA